MSMGSSGLAEISSNSTSTHVFAAPLELPAPERCVDLFGGRPLQGITIADRFEYRVPDVPGWLRGVRPVAQAPPCG